MFVLPATVIVAEVVPALVLEWVIVLVSPVIDIMLVWFPPAPKFTVVVLLSPVIVCVIVDPEHEAVATEPHVID